MRLLFVLAYHTGARAGALRELTWDRVDLERGLIRSTAKQARNKRVGVWPIYGDMERALREAEVVRERDWPDVDFVVHRAGKKLPPGGYRYAWAKGTKLAGLELHFHDLKRSAVRNLLDTGLDESSVMKITGQKTRAMIDRYRIVGEKDVQRARIKLETWLESRELERGDEVIN